MILQLLLGLVAISVLSGDLIKYRFTWKNDSNPVQLLYEYEVEKPEPTVEKVVKEIFTETKESKPFRVKSGGVSKLKSEAKTKKVKQKKPIKIHSAVVSSNKSFDKKRSKYYRFLQKMRHIEKKLMNGDMLIRFHDDTLQLIKKSTVDTFNSLGFNLEELLLLRKNYDSYTDHRSYIIMNDTSKISRIEFTPNN